MRFVWDYVVGPVAALLPGRWRRRVSRAREVEWTRAGTASGIYELIGAVIALGSWYMHEMGRVVSSSLEMAESGKLGGGVTEQQISGAGLTIFFLHPLTWLLFYFFFEGGVRLCGAAFTENVRGTLPLYLTERVVFWARNPEQARVGETVRANASSFAESIRERVMVARLKEVPDELEFTRSGAEELLEIRASRRKEEWEAPKIVRVDEVYYRLEESRMGSGARPFCYRLRRLAAGVPGRNVIVYRVGGERK